MKRLLTTALTLVALLAGPVVANFIGVPGIFWLMVALGLDSIREATFLFRGPNRLTP